MSRRFVATVATLFATASVAAQQIPARDAVSTPTSGTASVSGVVLNDEERPQPVRRAIVTLSGPELRPSRGAITDDEGRFSIRNLPAGRFTLIVSRASYVTSAYGAKRPGRPGTRIVLAGAEQVTNLTVRMWRGAVVAGVVRDAGGVPVPNLPVRAIPAKAPGSGALASLTNNGVRTNEAGEFRIFGLEPGTYVVAAQPAAGGSRMVELRDTEVDAIFESIKRRGAPAPPGAAPVLPPPQPFDLATVYHPSAIGIAQATPLTLAAGQVVTGADITLQRVSTSTVSGVVSKPDGSPASGATVQLSVETIPGPFAAIAGAPLTATAGADGTFRIVQVASGNYQLLARAPATPPPPQSGGFVTPGPQGAQLWASMAVSVNGDVGGLSLTVEPGLNVSGRLVFQSDTVKPPSNPVLRVNFVPPSVYTMPSGAAINTIAFVPGPAVRADGTFEIQGLPPGPVRLQVAGPIMTSGEWSIQSAMLGDRSLLDGDVEIRGGGTAELNIVLSDKTTELSGVLQSASGAPNSDVFVIAFSGNRSHWGPGTRRVQAVRPGVDGRYSIKGLPPGEYLVAAVLDIDQDDWNNPAFLEQLVPGSIKITIAEGEKKTQDLRIGR